MTRDVADVADLVIANAELDGGRVDLGITAGRVSHVAPTGELDGHDRIDGRGGAVLPGLHDHHVHLLATVAARRSVDVGDLGEGDRAVFVERVRDAARHPAPGGRVNDELRVVNYHESIAGTLDRHALDTIAAGRAVRLQHRTGQLWVLSSAAIARLGAAIDAAPAGFERDSAGEPTGRCWRIDGWLRAHRPRGEDDGEWLAAGLAELGCDLARLGVTGCTDATPFASIADAAPLLDAVGAGAFRQRLVVMGGPELAAASMPAPIALGPVKLLVDDHDPPPFDDLVTAVCAARDRGRAVAIHCVTRAGLALALALLDAAGGAVPGDRIEHGAVVAPDAAVEIAARGLTVVTQPAFVRTRGDRYLADVAATDRPHLWPCASLLDLGVPVAAGSDAPYGPIDPWLAIEAASTRRTASGRSLGDDRPLSTRQALDLHLGAYDSPGRPRRLAVGTAADLVLLDAPLAEVLAEPSAERVTATWIAGRRADRA